MFRLNFIIVIVCSLCFFLPCIFILFITPHGLAQSPDSVGYLMGAFGLLSGYKLQFISNHWPPFYSLLISFVGIITNVDTLFAARLLQSILFGSLTLVLIALLIRLRLSFPRAVILSFVIVTSPSCIDVSYYAWSELLFLNLLLLNTYIVSNLFIHQEKTIFQIYIAAASVTAALAFSTRYIGITIIISNLIILFRLRKQIVFTASFTVYIFILFLITSPWVIFYASFSESLTRREFAWHPVSVEQILAALNVIFAEIAPWKNLLPASLALFCLGASVFFISATILFRALKSSQYFRFDSTVFYLFIYISIYFLFLFLSISFLDVATPLDKRILLPVIVFFILVFGNCIYNSTTVWISRFGLIFLLVLFIYNANSLNRVSRLSYFNGIELSAKEFLNRPILKFILNCDPNIRVASSSPWELELQLGRRISALPRPYNMTSGKLNNGFLNEIAGIQNNFDLIIIAQSTASLYSNVVFEGYEIVYSDFDGKAYSNKNLPNLCKPI